MSTVETGQARILTATPRMQMFALLAEGGTGDAAAAVAAIAAPAAWRPNMSNGGIPAPPPSYIPPTGASFQTWPNVYMNLKNIDYCVDQFDQLSNRIHCINAFTGGPFLK